MTNVHSTAPAAQPDATTGGDALDGPLTLAEILAAGEASLAAHRARYRALAHRAAAIAFLDTEQARGAAWARLALELHPAGA